MEHIAYTEKLHGLTLKIVLDDHGCTESPLEHDTAVTFAALHRRYINPAKDTILAKPEGSEEMYYDFESVEGIAEFERDNESPDAEWAVFPLYMYDHSGTIYQCSEGGNPFSCQWDSGRVGIIALKKSEVGTPGEVIERKGQEPFTIGSYLKQAQDVCENYTAWANGNIYGFVIEDETGDHLDSCWGFIGDYDGYVLEEGRSVLKAIAAEHEPVHEFKFTRTETDVLVSVLTQVRARTITPAEYTACDALLSRLLAEFPHVECNCDAGGSAGCPVHDAITTEGT